MSKKTQHLYEFDEYLLNVEEKNLWRGEELVQIPPKVFETLCLLVEKRGKIVTKDEMLENIWIDSFVEESNISQNIYTLRRIFGNKKYIKTVPKKGYRFTARVKFSAIENFEKSDNENLIFATQTKTHIIEETTFEEENEALSKNPVRNRHIRKTALGVSLGTICAFFIGIFSYHFYQSNQTAAPGNIAADFEFKSLTDTGNAFAPAISPDGKLVVYLKVGDDDQKVHLKDVESGNDVELKITGDVKPGFFQFSPDGSRIFFRTKGVPQSAQKIYAISYFGGQPNLIVENVWGFFSFSPDGNKIAFYRSEPFSNKQFLVMKNLETGAEKPLLERSFPQKIFLHIFPAWSPDGGKIAFIPLGDNPNRSNIIVFNLETKTEETLKTELANTHQIIWLPDGKNLIVLAKDEDKGQQIWQLEYPGGRTERITNDLNSYRGLSMTADGKRIVTQKRHLTSNINVLTGADADRSKFVTRGNYGHYGLFDLKWTTDGKIIYDGRGAIDRDLWISSLTDENHIRLTQNKGSHNRNTAVSADGRFIYFVSDRRAAKNIWRMNSDGTNPVQMTFDEEAHNMSPALSPDDGWLYFVRQNKNSNALWRKSLTDEKLEKILEPDDFTFGNLLSVSPNGEYLAFHCIQTTKNDYDSPENDAEPTKFGFLKLSGGSEIKIVEINSKHRFIHWTNGGNAFDYVAETPLGDQIWRQSFVNENAPPELIFQLSSGEIYRFAWSSDGEDLAIARGKNQSDAVILEIGK